MQDVVVLPLQGVFDSSLALTLDTLAAANRLSGLSQGRELFRVSLHLPGRRQVETGTGAVHRVRARLRPGPKAALIVPGLGLAAAEEIDALFASSETSRLLRWLRAHAGEFPVVAASCSAVFLLAEAGLLEGKATTTTWWLAPVFRSRYPDIELDESLMVVESGQFLCAGAALAQIDLMLRLIARLAGPDLAAQVARVLAIELRPSQARYMVSSAVAGLGDEVIRAEAWVHKNLGRSFNITDMARELGMSARTLDRRLRETVGLGPSRFVQRIRCEHATHLIETTDLSMDSIAARVGYEDTASLRRLIKRERRASPGELRRGGLAQRSA